MLLFSVNVNAENTNGYVKMSDLKAFPTTLSIYLEDDQTHSCSASPSPIFESETANSQFTSFLLSAFVAGKGVNLSFNCDGTRAVISGVRLRQGS